MKDLVSKEGTTSIWTAQMVRQVHKTPYLLAVVPPRRTVKALFSPLVGLPFSVVLLALDVSGN